MSVLWWVLGAIGLLVVLVAAVVVGALVSVIRVEGRAGPEGVSGRGRWGVLGVEAEPGDGHAVFRLLGLRIARKPLKRGGSEASGAAKGEKEPEERERKRKPDRARLPLAAFRRLARTAWREGRQMLGHLQVDRLRLRAVIASDDPAWTGEAFGLGCVVADAIRAAWPHADVRLGVDFTAAEPSGSAELALRLRPVWLVPGAARIGWAVWRERRRSRHARRAHVARRTRGTTGWERRAWR
ncbi:MAG: hypothetical protein ACNA8N_12190 [Trueperaceae bacterium]